MGETDYYDLHRFDTYGILVPRTVPIEIAVRVAVAVLSYEMGLTMDYTLETYGTNLEANFHAQHKGEK